MTNSGGTLFFVAVGLDITEFMASSTAAMGRSAGALALTVLLTLVMAVIGAIPEPVFKRLSL